MSKVPETPIIPQTDFTSDSNGYSWDQFDKEPEFRSSNVVIGQLLVQSIRGYLNNYITCLIIGLVLAGVYWLCSYSLESVSRCGLIDSNPSYEMIGFDQENSAIDYLRHTILHPGPALMIVGLETVISLFYLWLMIGLFRVGLCIARRQRIPVSVLFSGHTALLRFTLFSLMFEVFFFIGTTFCSLIFCCYGSIVGKLFAVFALMLGSMGWIAITDTNAGPLKTIEISSVVMTDNYPAVAYMSLMIFALIYLVDWGLSGLGLNESARMSCLIALSPLWAVFYANFYLQATGEYWDHLHQPTD